jgi:PhzF family phenazine biosynthesis protein
VKAVRRPFRQVDVFTDTPYAGNPVAVVLDGDGLAEAEMARIANWTNLSETTFVLAPTATGADYQVRIFTPSRELPFAGHPTLGTCHAWLQTGGSPADPGVIVQECLAGLVRIRRAEGRLSFAAPPLVRSGPAEQALVDELVAAVGIDRDRVVAAEWVDNGPGWVALLLEDVESVLGAHARFVDHDVGLVALHPAGAGHDVEVRAFFPKDGAMAEDPVTGSLNASVAQWLLGSGRISAPYVARQGTALGRAGRVHVSADDDGTVWVGGGTITCVEGVIEA